MIYRHEPRYFEMFRRALSRHPRYPHLADWARRLAACVDAVYAAADAHQMDRAARQRMILHLDSRNLSLEVLLATIRHHATAEYPYLLDHEIDHNLTALYALNLNDRYWALRLTEALADSPLADSLKRLRDHLDHIPNKN